MTQQYHGKNPGNLVSGNVASKALNHLDFDDSTRWVYHWQSGPYRVTVRLCTQGGEPSGGVVITANLTGQWRHGTYRWPLSERRLSRGWDYLRLRNAIGRCLRDVEITHDLCHRREQLHDCVDSMTMPAKKKLGEEMKARGVCIVYDAMTHEDMGKIEAHLNDSSTA